MISLPSVVQFGAFQLDRQTGELRRSGRRVHLAPQAVRVLMLLTDRAGEVVTRDEIRAALWSDNTFVDFETAVNACVSQLRAALGDKPTAARFIETLPRRGYRFVAPVSTADRGATAPAALIAGPVAMTSEPDDRSSGQWRWIGGALCILTTGLVLT
ncbi:MAG: transcriptional regulator, partial [Vicinamibacterales bacterium]